MSTPNEQDREYLREAIGLARRSGAGTGGPFGAIVVIGGSIVGRGQNRVTSALDPTAHAEVVAIREACAALGRFELRGATLYASCEPCPMCLAAACWARVARIVYSSTRDDAAAAGFDDATLHAELAAPAAARKLPMESFLREEGLEAFRIWQANPNRTAY
jgi:tRNA(Arg) A34 adenosine deaminase TadA